MKDTTAEAKRLADNAAHSVFWKKWGPYLSLREDGLGGISDINQDLCFSIALWNGKDQILKERPFGLNNREGNHGEDVKELYYYLDNTPTHSYMKFLYKYPQQEFPYKKLLDTNGKRSRLEPEFELLDTGIFEGDRYFDVFVEYAKAAPEDILIKIEIVNRAEEAAEITLLPTLWFRNTWAYGRVQTRPGIRLAEGAAGTRWKRSMRG
jgi:hypothetical protein